MIYVSEYKGAKSVSKKMKRSSEQILRLSSSICMVNFIVEFEIDPASYQEKYYGHGRI